METRRRITAGCSSQFDLAFVFPNNIGIMWEVEGNGEARVFSIADVAGYNSIPCLSPHIELQLVNTVLAPFFKSFKPSDIDTTWV